jgi:aryl-alcohol dehydrogenase-like predicted oxidoreductase
VPGRVGADGPGEVGPGRRTGSPPRRYIIQQVEQSLRRLCTDHLDPYYAHFPDPDTPLEQTLRSTRG